MNDKKSNKNMATAVLTDIQFWIPVVVLAIGVLILIYVSRG